MATEYVTRYMAGSLQNTASSRSDGNCVEVSRGEWSGPESSFEMEWVQPRSVAHGSMIAHWETHVQQMHGNLTQRSATNWDHYMDYKACFLFDDCKLILQQLNRDAVPYFLVPHAGFFGVHIQAPGGIVVEAICPTTSKGDMNLKLLDNFAWCRSPREVNATFLLHGFRQPGLTLLHGLNATDDDDHGTDPGSTLMLLVLREHTGTKRISSPSS